MRPKVYGTLYERLVANTVLEHEDNPNSCWLWTGGLGSYRYPRLSVRVPGGGAAALPRSIAAHRAVLEELLDVHFPFDEAGHLCGNPRCVNPCHLEVQTRPHNLSERRRGGGLKGEVPMIPVLYPREPWAGIEAFLDAWAETLDVVAGVVEGIEPALHGQRDPLSP